MVRGSALVLAAGCHRTVGMVFGYRLRGLLSPLLNGGDIGCFLGTVSQGATEVCEEFYDTLLAGQNGPRYGQTSEPLAVPTNRYPYPRAEDSGVPFV